MRSSLMTVVALLFFLLMEVNEDSSSGYFSFIQERRFRMLAWKELQMFVVLPCPTFLEMPDCLLCSSRLFRGYLTSALSFNGREEIHSFIGTAGGFVIFLITQLLLPFRR